MFQSLLTTTLAWAKENCPESAMLGEKETRGRVQKAIEDTYVIRVVVAVTGSITAFFASYAFLDELGIQQQNGWQDFWPLLVVYLVIGWLAVVVDQYLLRRRVRLLLSGSSFPS